ncbi:uncharacterized protein LOC134018187 [Osmerus eperlanus]|uniref:uncharacterized protein LOC134018187 n=1 Tax=Osmerus eperlanus TaxID=29151 RepID=UPI002E10C0C3
MTKPKSRPCPYCQVMNTANRKTCLSCFASLSTKERIKSKEESLHVGDWGENVKKHRNAGRVIDSARISVNKLHELDLKPLLFMGKEKRGGGGFTAEVIAGIGFIPEGPVREIIKKMTTLYEYYLKYHNSLLATAGEETPDETPEATSPASTQDQTFTLNLVPVPHTPPMTPSLSSSTLPTPSLSSSTLPTPSLSSSTLPTPSLSSSTLPTPSLSSSTLPTPSLSSSTLPTPSLSSSTLPIPSLSSPPLPSNSLSSPPLPPNSLSSPPMTPSLSSPPLLSNSLFIYSSYSLSLFTSYDSLSLFPSSSLPLFLFSCSSLPFFLRTSFPQSLALFTSFTNPLSMLPTFYSFPHLFSSKRSSQNSVPGKKKNNLTLQFPV